jgi:hypothetical protein
VLLLITHGRREPVRANGTAHPTAAWAWRRLVEATARSRRSRPLLRDRDAVSGGEVAARAKGRGIEPLRTPARAPRATGSAERAVRTLRNEGLDHVIPLSEAHPRTIPAEFVTSYDAEPPLAACSSSRPGRGPDPRPGPFAPGRCWAAGTTSPGAA